eukprot:4579746-Pyramimonas_sp.AAC.1
MDRRGSLASFYVAEGLWPRVLGVPGYPQGGGACACVAEARGHGHLLVGPEERGGRPRDWPAARVGPRAMGIMRGPRLLAWTEVKQRSWGCASHGRTAEDAAWEVLFAHEADDPGEVGPAVMAAMAAIWDFRRGFRAR